MEIINQNHYLKLETEHSEDNPRPLFRLFLSLQAHTIQVLQQINAKNVHPVYGAGIRTYNLQV